MHRVFLPVTKTPIDPLPTLMQLWLGNGPEGALLGVFTDEIRSPLGSVSTALGPDLTHLCHIGTLQKVLQDPDLAREMGWLSLSTETLMQDLKPSCYTSGMCWVDDMAVECDTVSYLGLTFLLGRDVHRYPFAVMQREHMAHKWPKLRSTEDRA